MTSGSFATHQTVMKKPRLDRSCRPTNQFPGCHYALLTAHPNLLPAQARAGTGMSKYLRRSG